MYTLYPLTSLNRIFRLLLISAYGEHDSDSIIKYDLCHMFGLLLFDIARLWPSLQTDYADQNYPD